MPGIAQVKAAIVRMGGRARVRVVRPADVDQVLIEAHRDGYGSAAGSTVANCYGYPAERMRLAAVRGHDGRYYVFADWGNATGGSSPIPSALPRQYSQNDQLYAAKLQQIAPTLAGYAVGVVSATDVRTLISMRKEELRRTIAWTHPTADISVTRDHSIRAGNCARETDRVQAAIGKPRISARKLRAWITTHQPHLWRYADKAIEIALQDAV